LRHSSHCLVSNNRKYRAFSCLIASTSSSDIVASSRSAWAAEPYQAIGGSFE
jgi:hypothetical protein